MEPAERTEGADERPAERGLLVVVAGAASHRAGLLAQMEGLATRLAAAAGGAGAAAWFDQGHPTLTAVLEAAVGKGHRSVLVVPYLLQWGFPDQFSLPAQLRAFAAAHPSVAVRLAAPPGLTPAIEETVAERAQQALAGPPISELDERALAACAAYDDMPPRRPARPAYPAAQAHLLLCQGRWCLAAGATALEQSLRSVLQQRGLERGRGRVQLTRTRCVGPCGGAPLVVHYPQGDWYWGLRPHHAPQLVDAVTGGEADGLAAQRFRPGESEPLPPP